MPPIRFSQLLSALPQPPVSLSESDVLVQGVALDSRRVGTGDLFVAVSGGTTDGHRFIQDAIRRGAAAVVGTHVLTGLAVPYARVADSRLALAYLAAGFYGFPARHLTVIGVTGTDGKTTTANLIYHILNAAGLRAGMISTVEAVVGDRILDTGFHVTTPEAPEIQRLLAEMLSTGISHVVLEATSHGLAQNRVAACDFDLAAITNITHEHLDYHGSYQDYRAAKGRLFTGMAQSAPKPFGPPRAAILNRDDRSYEYLAGITPAGVRQISYGMHTQSEVRAEGVQTLPDGLAFMAILSGERVPLSLHLLGDYNVSNALAAVAVAHAGLGLAPQAIGEGLLAFQGVPGRMERVELGQLFTAIVDFAHTPNALRRALQFARQMISAPGRVIAVFGSAGLRDREKRRLMAENAAELADLTILTAEDPRTESLELILAEMAAGMLARGAEEGRTFWRVPDRGEALRMAVRLAQPGDILLACGKGHEQSMCFGEVEYPWDDRLALRAALAENLHIPGPAMPYLPTQDEAAPNV